MSTPSDVLTSVSRQSILSKLIEKSDGGRLRYPLAANVQERNIERLARRWA